MNHKVVDEICFDVVLYGWIGEILESDRPRGACRATAPRGSLLWDFLPQWIQARPKAREYFLDSDQRLKADVMVVPNGMYQNLRDEVELHDGDLLVLLRVASGG